MVAVAQRRGNALLGLLWGAEEKEDDAGMSAAMIDGPRIEPRGGPAKSLVVFLHGYGADGNDLIDIGRLWAPLMPDTAFVSPHAPEPCGESPTGRQWFPLAGMDQGKLREGVVAAAPILDQFLDQELASHRLGEDRLALVGFSHGTMMALHIAPRRARPVAGVIGYSGLLPGPEFLTAETRQHPPILLVHGDVDPLIPSVALYAAARLLGDAGFPVEWHVRPGLAHGIDQEGLDLGAGFIKRVLR
jgi:phospholipase/carboxylesterase